MRFASALVEVHPMNQRFERVFFTGNGQIIVGHQLLQPDFLQFAGIVRYQRAEVMRVQR